MTSRLKSRRSKLYLIRTKIDELETNECAAEEEMVIDRKILKEWKVEPTEHLSISTVKEEYQYQLVLLKLLMSTP